jgi:hypothetical protein
MLRKKGIEKNVDNMNTRKIYVWFNAKTLLDSHLRLIFLRNTTFAHVECNYL